MTRVALGLPAVRGRTGGPPAATGDRPDVAALVDRFGRVATDLRVSLIDRCNLRCSYCMPPEGLDWMPAEQRLGDDELIRLIGIAVDRLGVREVRFTGGEPLLRQGLERIVAATTALRTADGQPPRTALTTNGLGLRHRAAALAAAGLSRVNVSLDTLDRARFAGITNRDRLPDVLDGLAAADAAGLAPVKINAVLLRGVNDDEAVPLLRWAIGRGYRLRFIEQMPLDPHGAWDRAEMMTAEQILAALATAYRLEPTDAADRASAPAESWTVHDRDGRPVLDARGDPARVGVIGSVTRTFCGACDRTRLTADGQVRNCLFAREETDLRAALRAGAGDDELAAMWRAAMWGKQAGHGIDDPAFLQPTRPMSAIGG